MSDASNYSSVIKNRTNDEDAIVMLGGRPEIFIYTGRKRAFSHDMAILQCGTSGIRTQEWEKAYISDVERAKPKYLIFFDNPLSSMTGVTDPAIFQWFEGFTARNYRLEGIVDTIGPFQTNYLWDSQVENYKLQTTQSAVFIYRRNDAGF